jgi:hypothetical protein
MVPFQRRQNLERKYRPPACVYQINDSHFLPVCRANVRIFTRCRKRGARCRVQGARQGRQVKVEYLTSISPEHISTSSITMCRVRKKM